MNKNILKISIAALILLIGIGAVSAFESNSTNDYASSENNDVISVSDNVTKASTIETNKEILADNNDSEVLASENEHNLSSTYKNDDDVLAIENDSEEIAATNDNDSEVLTFENKSNTVSVSNAEGNLLTLNNVENDKLSSASQTIQRRTQHKTLTLINFKIPVKFKRFMHEFKIPSKKNKKAWNLYVQYCKWSNVAKKRIISHYKKLIINLKKIKYCHWKGYGDTFYKLRKIGNYYVISYYIRVYRTYNYNPATHKGWWS